jgi:hypothetical protein
MHNELDCALDGVKVRVGKIVSHNVSVRTTTTKAMDFTTSTSVLVELQRGVFQRGVVASATFIMFDGAASFGEGIESAF